MAKKEEQGKLNIKAVLEEKLAKGETVDLMAKYPVEFTEDFGFMKKGHKQNVSEIVYLAYKKVGVIKDAK